MNKALYYLVIMLMICVGTTLKFANKHEDIPIGCDEFDNLNLAKTFDCGQSVNRPYLNELLSTLRGEGITEPEIDWMVTPHAYHVIPGTDLVINQYPPGTSFLLSLIPFAWRNLLFPFLVMLLLVIFPFLNARNNKKQEWNLFDLVFPILLFIITVSTPFTTELARVNSLAVTFGLLVAAGMKLKSRPLFACFFIALTANFRIVNILMVMPVVFFLPFVSKHESDWAKQNITLLLKFGCLVFAALLPVLIYNYQLLGNPLASTYSSIDTAVSHGSTFFANMNYYLSFDQHWLRVHLAAVVLLVAFSFTSKMPWSYFFKVVAFPLLNYIFFGWHAVTMDYYPYTSAMLMIGVILGILTESSVSNKLSLISQFIGIALAAVVLISGINRYKKREHLSSEQARAKYAALCSYDIVWCDLLSGTSEYVCGNNGFRFATSTPKARKLALQFLNSRNYNQVILLNDIPMETAKIEAEINNSGLVFNKGTDKNLGVLLVIPGKPSDKKPLR